VEWISLGCRHALLIQQENLTAQTPWLCIIFNSALNLHFDEWGAAFPNKLMGAATLDRLRDRAYQIVLDGETRRKPRSMPEVTSTARAKVSSGAAKPLTATR